MTFDNKSDLLIPPLTRRMLMVLYLQHDTVDSILKPTATGNAQNNPLERRNGTLGLDFGKDGQCVLCILFNLLSLRFCVYYTIYIMVALGCFCLRYMLDRERESA